jgi:hypothetical protein
MEFETAVRGEYYRFSFLNTSSVLVSGQRGEYILYKNRTWRCADDLSNEIVEELGDIIEEHLQVRHRR